MQVSLAFTLAAAAAAATTRRNCCARFCAFATSCAADKTERASIIGCLFADWIVAPHLRNHVNGAKTLIAAAVEAAATAMIQIGHTHLRANLFQVRADLPNGHSFGCGGGEDGVAALINSDTVRRIVGYGCNLRAHNTHSGL